MENKYEDVSGSGSDGGEINTPKENFNVGAKTNSTKDLRAQRNSVERKRKGKLIMYISQLSELIPKDYLPSTKKTLSNNSVLELAVRYMHHLKEQSNLFFSSHGTEAQRNEIKRLKEKLAVVSEERDKFEKMVQQAAAVTPNMLASISSKAPLVSSEGNTKQLFTSSAADRLPGQGVIITQTGQAYYVNEQGIPVAQLMSDNVTPKSTLAPTYTPPSLPVSAAASSTTSTLPHVQTTSESQVTAGNVPNGLVALPGHNGQLPSAIILPNGQVIPMVTSASTQNTDSNNPLPSTAAGQLELSSTVSTTVTSTTVMSTAPSHSDLTCSASNTSGIMLIGGQQALPGSTVSAPMDVSLNQLGRKIMPKPPMYGQMAPMAAPFTLAPLPMPACSINIAPTMFNHDGEAGKKKKTRKKKPKESDLAVAKDVLATAAETLFSPEQEVPTTSHFDTASVGLVPPQMVSACSPMQMIPIAPNPLNGVRARRTKKRKIKEAKKASLPDDCQKSTKAAKSFRSDTDLPATSPGAHPSVDPGNDCADPEESHGEQSQSIEFDPNDLENILEQVENIEGMAPASESLPGVLKEKETNIQSDYVLAGDEEIGPVFTTSAATVISPDKQSNDMNKAHNNTLASDSYLVASLKKNTEQPVDHRRQNQKELGSAKPNLDSHSSHGGGENYPYQRSMSMPQSSIDVVEIPNDNVPQHTTVVQRSEQHSNLVDPKSSQANFAQQPSNTRTSSLAGQITCESPVNQISPGNVNTSSQQYAVHQAGSLEGSVETDATFRRQGSFVETLQINTAPMTSQNSFKSATTVSHSNTASFENFHSQSMPLSQAAKVTPPYTQSVINSNLASSTTTSVPAVSHSNLSSNLQHNSTGNSLIPHSNYVHESFAALPLSSPPNVSNPGTQFSGLQSNHSKALPSAPSYKNTNITSGHTPPSLPAWSPAKDAEKWPSRSVSGSGQGFEQTPPSLSTTSSYQQMPFPQYPPLNQINEEASMSKAPHSFQGDPYQYTQFTTSNTIPSSSHPIVANYTQPTASHSKFESTQNTPTPSQFCSNNTTSQMLGRDSVIWSKVPQGTENMSYDLSRSSSGHESLSSQSSDQQALNQAHSKNANQKGSRTKRSAKDKREPSRLDQSHTSSDAAQRPAGSRYTQPHDMYGHSQDGSSRSRITLSNIATSKSSVFSAESILTKRKVSMERDKSQESQFQSLQSVGSSNVPMDHSQLLQKDRSFMTSQGYGTPFNVNLFTSSAPPVTPLNSVSSSLKHSFADPSFTFSLTSTACPSVSASSYEKAPTQLSFPSQHSTRHNAIHDVDQQNMSSSSLHSSLSGSGMSSQPLTHTYPNQFDLNPSNSHPFKPNPHVANTLQQAPPVVKPKQTKSHHPESVKDLPNMAYGFPTQTYGMPAFSSNQPADTHTNNLFNPQPLYNNPSASLGLSFQHTGFTGLPTRSANDFSSHASQMEPSPRFSINHIFREKPPIDPFKLTGNNSAGSSVYTPPHSNIYPNPMGIFGSPSGFDINRAPSVAALAATNPSLAGFRHPFDFNIPSQR